MAKSTRVNNFVRKYKNPSIILTQCLVDGTFTYMPFLLFQKRIDLSTFTYSSHHFLCPESAETLPLNGLLIGACFALPFRLSNNISINKMKSAVYTASAGKLFPHRRPRKNKKIIASIACESL